MAKAVWEAYRHALTNPADSYQWIALVIGSASIGHLRMARNSRQALQRHLEQNQFSFPET